MVAGVFTWQSTVIDVVCTSGHHGNTATLGSLVVLPRPHTAHDVISSSRFQLPTWPRGCMCFMLMYAKPQRPCIPISHVLWPAGSHSCAHHSNPVLAALIVILFFFCLFFFLELCATQIQKREGNSRFATKESSCVNAWGAAVLSCRRAEFVFCDQAVVEVLRLWKKKEKKKKVWFTKDWNAVCCLDMVTTWTSVVLIWLQLEPDLLWQRKESVAVINCFRLRLCVSENHVSECLLLIALHGSNSGANQSEQSCHFILHLPSREARSGSSAKKNKKKPEFFCEHSQPETRRL